MSALFLRLFSRDENAVGADAECGGNKVGQLFLHARVIAAATNDPNTCDLRWQVRCVQGTLRGAAPDRGGLSVFIRGI